MTARAKTAKQAREEINVSKNKFYDMVKTGEIKTIRAGRKILVPEWAIAQFLGETNPKQTTAI